MGRTSDAQAKLRKAVTELIWKGSYAGTTVDEICAKARVQKGTFYYFYKSKSDLAIDALDESFVCFREELNKIFNPAVPGLERIRNHCSLVYQYQAEMNRQCGRVLGCPLFTLGSELTPKESKLREKVQSHLHIITKYFENAIRDAAEAGEIEEENPKLKAQLLMSYFSGLLVHARIQNDLGILKNMLPGALILLKTNEPALS